MLSEQLLTSEDRMHTHAFVEVLESRIAKYDLLRHPFYRAWSAGRLTREDLRDYSRQYYHHVAAFPTYLSAFHSRLSDGELRRAVLRNLADEEIEGTPHSELWLDFAEAMGNDREHVRATSLAPVVDSLITTFRTVASSGSPAAAVAGFYTYESQVPRIAEFKERALRDLYGADDRACRYFALHKTADVHHSRVWRELLEQVIAENPETAGEALQVAE
jgi:pyrroloquinoline-quinone synthase